jgi:DNA-binding response OmpR family regulator
MGADDYITKPFSPRELLARLRVALRHSHSPASASQVVFDGIVVDFQKVEVTRNGALVVLTAHEFKTLQFFVENPDRVITRAELLKRVCGYEDGYTTTRTIDNHIMKLRYKLENDPSCPTHFRTVPRLGSRFAFQSSVERIATPSEPCNIPLRLHMPGQICKKPPTTVWPALSSSVAA